LVSRLEHKQQPLKLFSAASRNDTYRSGGYEKSGVQQMHQNNHSHFDANASLMIPFEATIATTRDNVIRDQGAALIEQYDQLAFEVARWHIIHLLNDGQDEEAELWRQIADFVGDRLTERQSLPDITNTE
jgi:hypothetical protein